MATGCSGLLRQRARTRRAHIRLTLERPGWRVAAAMDSAGINRLGWRIHGAFCHVCAQGRRSIGPDPISEDQRADKLVLEARVGWCAWVGSGLRRSALE